MERPATTHKYRDAQNKSIENKFPMLETDDDLATIIGARLSHHQYQTLRKWGKDTFPSYKECKKR